MSEHGRRHHRPPGTSATRLPAFPNVGFTVPIFSLRGTHGKVNRRKSIGARGVVGTDTRCARDLDRRWLRQRRCRHAERFGSVVSDPK